jgi:histidinol-phosphate aminotransferase
MYDTPRAAESALRLHLNEHTGGCSPAVIEALRSITPTDASFYPDYAGITASVERYFGVERGWVHLTNGLDEGLHLVAQAAALAWSRDGRAAASRRGAGVAMVVTPAFEMYEASAEAVGLDVVRIAPEPEFRFPIEAIARACSPRTRVLYLTDPNNPTGLGIPDGAVASLASAAPETTILVDEAYADFSGRTVIGPQLERHGNLIAGRTFAKAHGLAALRVGALVAHPDALVSIRRVAPPFSLNICAVRALEAAMADRGYVEQAVRQSRESRRLIEDFCRRHGFHFWPSEANFVLFRVGDRAVDIVRALAGRGVLVRDRSTQPGCAGCIRVTAGVVAHTARGIAALEDVLASLNG